MESTCTVHIYLAHVVARVNQSEVILLHYIGCDKPSFYKRWWIYSEVLEFMYNVYEHDPLARHCHPIWHFRFIFKYED